MGAHHDVREATDRKRLVVPRKQGSTSGKYRTWGLVIPSWLAREIAGEDDPDEIERVMRTYCFSPIRTPEGILYRAVKRVVVEDGAGW